MKVFKKSTSYILQNSSCDSFRKPSVELIKIPVRLFEIFLRNPVVILPTISKRNSYYQLAFYPHFLEITLEINLKTPLWNLFFRNRTMNSFSRNYPMESMEYFSSMDSVGQFFKNISHGLLQTFFENFLQISPGTPSLTSWEIISSFLQKKSTRSF